MHLRLNSTFCLNWKAAKKTSTLCLLFCLNCCIILSSLSFSHLVIFSRVKKQKEIVKWKVARKITCRERGRPVWSVAKSGMCCLLFFLSFLVVCRCCEFKVEVSVLWMSFRGNGIKKEFKRNLKKNLKWKLFFGKMST